ncbi:hypothetical protein [Nocardia arizonensis]|uniref:hypothetical protein n=1 Tax=Nocardia arizonensis TaxID=1141647 RepID=UPI000A81E2FC|nr:hypothetical protein [Nocardia arizonensis]
MGISVSIQDRMHVRVNGFVNLDGSTLSRMVLAAPKGSMLDAIHAYADTMFNSYQLQFFVDELAAMTPSREDERRVIEALQVAAEDAMRTLGYLWFTGD